MEHYKIENKKSDLFKVLLGINLFAIVFFALGATVNVYKQAAVGAMFEILWFPAVTGIIGIPFLALYFWRHDQFNARSKYLYLLGGSLISALIFLLLVK